MNIIPVVFSVDENFAAPACVAIGSLLQKAHPETFYDIFILLKKESLSVVKAVLDNLCKYNFSYKMNYITISENDLQDAQTTHSSLSIATYMRLFIPELLTEYEKCIYLDGDILVCEDLTELYEVSLGDCLLAAVKDGWQNRLKAKEHEKKLNMPSIDDYINAGVLVMNLYAMRQCSMVDMFRKKIATELFEFEDQDIINSCCYGKKRFLPVRYNLFCCYLNAESLLDTKVYSGQELQNANCSAIVHFPGNVCKPWKCLGIKMGDVWWGYAKRFLEENKYNEIYRCACDFTRHMEWITLNQWILRQKCIVIFGYSEIGRRLFDSLCNMNITKVVGFVDNNIEKQKETYYGKPVLSIEQALGRREEVSFINTSQIYFKTIEKQLMGMGVKEENIFRYYNKSEIYYMSIVPSCYSDEVREIMQREYGSTGDEMKFEELEEREKERVIEKYYMRKWLYLEREG